MTPPLLESRPDSEPEGWTGAWPAWLFLGLLGLLAGARLAELWRLPLPHCWFKTITGLPCAFCGATRAASAAAGLDFATAIRLNPLACALGAAAVALFVAWAADRWLGTRWGPRLRGWAAWPWYWIGLAALILNWIYLLAARNG